MVKQLLKLTGDLQSCRKKIRCHAKVDPLVYFPVTANGNKLLLCYVLSPWMEKQAVKND